MIHSGAGTLYIVATPIGHLSDMSPRAVEILKAVDVILAEDTRHSQKLLRFLNIEKPLSSLHEHNERQAMAGWIEKLKQGATLALISDAGTPLIHDPGYLLVHEAHREAIRVVPIPGPCALITALCASGLPAQRFHFEGFLPSPGADRRRCLQALADAPHTLVFYETPHRILAALADMAQAFGPDREMALARELTKQYETIRHGSIADIQAFCAADSNQQRGEMVLVVAGKPRVVAADETLSADATRVLTILLDALPTKQAVQLAVKITGEKKNKLYARATQAPSGE